MGQLRSVYVGRSDGTLNTHNPRTRVSETNAPTQEQLTPSVANGLTNYYVELPIGNPKSLDWRKKLGGLLMREMKKQTGAQRKDPSGSTEEYVLAAFPENYRLYEHRRVANPDQPDARGANDRRDVYLYGHPQGRKKRFRSPADFFLHLLWLAKDEDAQTEDCACKLCTSEDFVKSAQEMLDLQANLFGASVPGSVAVTPTPAAVPGLAPSSTSTSALAPGTVTQTGPSPNPSSTSKSTAKQQQTAASVATTNPSSQLPSPSTMLNLKPAPSPASSAPISSPSIQSLVPTPPVAARNNEQALDAKINKFLYRVGEVVWYQRGAKLNGPVGLGAVVARDFVIDQGLSRGRYTIQPLSHPFGHPAPVSVAHEPAIKPWLAFSTPDSFHESLKGSTLTYDRIDWRGLLDGLYGKGDTEADASMFAAKAVDISYTLFEPLPKALLTQPETRYNGMFLGGEKVWTGEAVRLRIGSGRDILIVSDVIDMSASASRPGDVFVVGDIYTYNTIAYDPKRQIPRNTYLPQRMQHDLDFRNRASIAKRNVVSHWKLVQARARVALGDIRGRWYESSVVLPILLGQQTLHNVIEIGDVPDVGSSLNSRASSNPTIKNGNRKDTRLQAFDGSIPASTLFNEVGPAFIPQTPSQPALTGQPQFGRPPSNQQNNTFVGQASSGGSNDNAGGVTTNMMDIDQPGYGQNYQGQIGGGQRY